MSITLISMIQILPYMIYFTFLVKILLPVMDLNISNKTQNASKNTRNSDFRKFTGFRSISHALACFTPPSLTLRPLLQYIPRPQSLPCLLSATLQTYFEEICACAAAQARAKYINPLCAARVRLAARILTLTTTSPPIPPTFSNLLPHHPFSNVSLLALLSAAGSSSSSLSRAMCYLLLAASLLW